MSDSFVTLPGSSVHVISQARILEWVSISFSKWSSWPTDWTWISFTAAGIFFTTEQLSKPGGGDGGGFCGGAASCFSFMEICFFFLSVLFFHILYSWSLNNMGLNCASPLAWGYFSVVNSIVLRGSCLFECKDVEKPQIRRLNCKLYTQINPWVVQCSTVLSLRYLKKKKN